MKNVKQIHYTVQVEVEGGFPINIAHTHKKETDEYFYEFLDKKKAIELMEAEKLLSPNERFRVVKRTTIYQPMEWK